MGVCPFRMISCVEGEGGIWWSSVVVACFGIRDDKLMYKKECFCCIITQLKILCFV